MALGRGGGDDKHTHSTAADQPAPLPDYKVAWFWVGGFVGGGVWGGGMTSTCAQLLQTKPNVQIHRVLGHTPQGIHVNTHAHNHIHGLASIHSNICHETYTSHMSCDIHADKHKQAHTCSRMRVFKHTSRANISTRMHARQAFCKKRSRSDPFARSLSEPFARRLSDPLPLQTIEAPIASSKRRPCVKNTDVNHKLLIPHWLPAKNQGLLSLKLRAIDAQTAFTNYKISKHLHP